MHSHSMQKLYFRSPFEYSITPRMFDFANCKKRMELPGFELGTRRPLHHATLVHISNLAKMGFLGIKIKNYLFSTYCLYNYQGS